MYPIFYLLKGDYNYSPSSAWRRATFDWDQAKSMWQVESWPRQACFWVAVKELKLSYYIGETLLLTRYTHHGNLT